MTATVAILLSAAAMTLIVGLRYLASRGAFALATRAVRPGLYTGLDAQIRREIAWSLASAAIYGVPAGIVAWGWQNRGWTRIYTDLARLSALVSAAVGAALSRRARHLVLLDASLDAPAARRSASRMPSTMPAARRPPGRRWRSTRSRR